MTPVDHAAVQRAQRKVGDQLERERLERIRVRDRRRYGPHNEDDAPRTVTVYAAGKWPTEEERPIPEALLHQRRQVNAIANAPTPVAQVLDDATAQAANEALLARLRRPAETAAA